MLEKIGLPAKPSLRGNSWVVDASHCQGCSSQFTFINRKHHCRRCGGLFCGSCTQQKMSLRGQGDSPVRICEPCKKLEEAARFELRHGYKNRLAKGGSSKRTVKNEDDVLSEILGSDVDVSSSAESVSSTDRVTSKEMASSSSNKDMELDDVSASPEELRKQAVEEKNKYRVLKGEGKSEEALKAFKRGKELEREADALEITLRKNRKRVLSMQNVAETQNKAATKESSKSLKPPRQGGKGNEDLSTELRELGWSDDEEKKPATVSLEGEFSSLLREVPQRTNPQKSGGIDKSQVIAIKKKALALKREGKLAEAKEELKRAKVLERELEERELLGGADESDDELSALINSMDDDKEDDLLAQYEGSHDFDISNLVGNVDDIHGEYDVTDEDMEDPAIAAALKSLGWTEDPGHRESAHPQPSPKNREESLAEIQTLKREALNLKRAGNVAEAMATLKKAKLLEKELEAANTSSQTVDTTRVERDTSLKLPPRSRLAIQKELLAVKKKALTLRREGKFNEAEEELKKGAVLQNQLDELDNSSKLASAGKAVREKGNVGNDLPDISRNSMDIDDGEVDVKDEELNDPNYLSMLKSLGWNDEDNNPAGSSSAKPNPVSSQPRRSKAEIQRELLGLKRKALTLRRQGNVDEAEEVLNQTKILEAQMMEIDSGKNLHAESNQLKKISTDCGINEGDDNVTENDMKDPALLSTLKNLGWEEEEPKKEEAAFSSTQSTAPRIAAKTKGQIQRELLDLKRKALAFKRQGKTVEAEELYCKANVLEAQLAELETPKMETKGSASAINPKDYMDVDILVGSQMENKAVKSSSGSHSSQDNFDFDLLGDFISPAKSGSSTAHEKTESRVISQPSRQQPNMMDLLTGEHCEKSQIHAEKAKAETKSDIGLGNTEPRVAREESEPGNIHQSASVQNTSPQSTLKQEILAYKRKALALKKEGKMSEAREALQQAKLLERRQLQEGENPSPEKLGRDDMVSATQHPPPAREKENSPSSSAPKPMSSRDRFKLQQESLSHKRQAMKLRREGKMEEAEAEFEIAKTLEAQLEDSTSSKPEPVDDVAVEDFLDPQLLSALKAIGLDNPVNPPSMSRTETTQAAAKPNPVMESNQNNNQERSQLEERIKAEKVKAVTLKRAGKQAEALDALRRAKLYEKKLNALASN
ncbi:Protein FREE1 [Cardamine amara subsp. amara]|uniref:Protein FREE1 n=1 Tax=Cardamine amara subsp. amara TaxID=228776 RepID=A0ABD0ZNB9_CARAN